MTDEKPIDYAPAPAPASSTTLWLARSLLLLAAAIAAYLLIVSLLHGSVAGCSGTLGGCNAVLESHWSRIWKIPVSAPALLTYLLLLFYSFAPADRRSGSIAMLSAAILGAALWFTFLQVYLLKSYCYFCLSAHLAGSLAAILLLVRVRKSAALSDYFTAFILVVLLAFGQKYLPSPTASWNSWDASGGPELVHSLTPTPTLSLYKNRFDLNLREIPVLGNPDAPHIALVLYDPTCPHCRQLHELLSAARPRLGPTFAIALLPAPLEARCNPHVTSVADTGACYLAQLTLAVYVANPSQFETFLDFAFNNPLAREPLIARAKAAELVSEKALTQALENPRTQSLLDTGIALYGANRRYANSGKMPQMILGPDYMYGEPTESELNQKLTDFMQQK